MSELATPQDRLRILYDLLNTDAPNARQEFLDTLRVFVAAGMDLDEQLHGQTEQNGWTLFMVCHTGQLEEAKALVEAGADPSAGRWWMSHDAYLRKCSVDKCVGSHPFWFDVDGDFDDPGRFAYLAFLLDLVSAGRLELPAPCGCTDTTSVATRAMIVAAGYAQRLYHEGLSRLLAEFSQRDSRLPREVWLHIVLPYVHAVGAWCCS